MICTVCKRSCTKKLYIQASVVNDLKNGIADQLKNVATEECLSDQFIKFYTDISHQLCENRDKMKNSHDTYLIILYWAFLSPSYHTPTTS